MERLWWGDFEDNWVDRSCFSVVAMVSMDIDEVRGQSYSSYSKDLGDPLSKRRE